MAYPPVALKVAARRKRARRLLYVYRVMAQVVLSYAFLAMRRRFHGQAHGAHLVESAHRRNARRVLGAIVALQGLFIKVGQLISVMANLLPDAFRKQLET